MSAIRCKIHNAIEEDREGDYLSCMECGHIFRTAEELVDADLAWQEIAWADGWTRVPPRRREPKDVFPCPLCSHDL